MRNAIVLILLFLGFIDECHAQFSEPNYFPWEYNAANWIIFGDTDNDGDIDFIDARNDTGPRFIENTGEDLYNPYVTISEDVTGSHDYSHIFDYDGDGDLDFFSVTNPSGQFSLFSNDGTNHFEHTVIYTADHPTQDLIFIDIDGDGDIDIFYEESSTVSHWLENNGDETFTPIDLLVTDEDIRFPYLFDMDSDGDKDFFFYEIVSNNIMFSENIGDDFTGPVSIGTSGSGINSFSHLDADDDGDLDLFYADKDEDIIMLIPNLGGGEFDDAVLFATHSEPRLHPSVDLDFDGKDDLIISSNSYGLYHWVKNLGDGDFSSSELLIPSTRQLIAQFSDFDNDGDLDLIGHTDHYTLMYFENLGDLVFNEMTFLSETALMAIETLAMDVNNDGYEDIICSSSQDRKISWVMNEGGGTFSEIRVIIAEDSLNPFQTSLVNMDDDSDLDILVVSTMKEEIIWYENIGEGNFGEKNVISDLIPDPICAIGEDWDEDGDIDIIGSSLADGRIALFENIDGSFDPIGVTLALDGKAFSFESGDIDGDGDLDFVWTSEVVNHVRWLENTGDLSFTEHLLATDSDYIKSIELEDLDEDGDLDVLIAAFGNLKILAAENLGGGIFEDPVILVSSDQPNNVHWADMNNDGVKDLIVSEFSDDGVTWFENLGDLEFSENLPLATSEGPLGMIDFAIGDYDRDGDNDVSFITYSFNRWGWTENMNITEHSVRGKVFIDANENGTYDMEEEPAEFAQILSSPESFFSFTSYTGDYIVAFDETEFGDYSIFPAEIDFWDFTTPESYDVTISDGFTLYENLDFGIIPGELVNRVEPTITAGVPRIDTEVNYWLNYSNTGSTIPSGSLHLELDEELTFISADITPELIDGQNIYWSYEDLGYFVNEDIQVTVLMPGVDLLGETITSYFTVEVEEDGATVFTNMDSLEQVIQGAYDPNDKTVRPAGIGEFGYIHPSTETLEYLVRFQNTGTDTAFLVVIKDQLDANLDWASLEPLAWSHDMEIEVDHDGEISFIFDNIMLPDSNVNQLASNGFVKYQIDLLPDLPLETSIYNTAHIFFDANPAVITNTTINTLHIDDDSGIIEEGANYVSIYPNPFSEFSTVRFAKELTTEHTIIVYDIVGTEVYRQTNIKGQIFQINKDQIGNGLFILTVVEQESGTEILSTKLLTE